MEQFFLTLIGTFVTLFQVIWVAFVSLIPETTIGKLFFGLAILLGALVIFILISVARDDATETNNK